MASTLTRFEEFSVIHVGCGKIMNTRACSSKRCTSRLVICIGFFWYNILVMRHSCESEVLHGDLPSGRIVTAFFLIHPIGARIVSNSCVWLIQLPLDRFPRDRAMTSAIAARRLTTSSGETVCRVTFTL